MSLFGKLRDFVTAEDEEEILEEEEEIYDATEPKYKASSRNRGFGLPPATEPLPKREPMRESIREPLSYERERKNVIPLRGAEELDRLTKKFKIMVSEPKAFDECPKLVDSLKSRKPVIINLEHIENDTARKIFDFLSGATYALNGNVQKIAQNIFVFLPENVDVQTSADAQDMKYREESDSHWR